MLMGCVLKKHINLCPYLHDVSQFYTFHSIFSKTWIFFFFVYFWATFSTVQKVGPGFLITNHSWEAWGPYRISRIEPGWVPGWPHTKKMLYHSAIALAPKTWISFLLDNWCSVSSMYVVAFGFFMLGWILIYFIPAHFFYHFSILLSWSFFFFKRTWLYRTRSQIFLVFNLFFLMWCLYFLILLF